MSTVADFEFEALARRVAVLETQGEVLTEGVADLEERLRRERGQAVIERDAAEEACDRLRAEVGRLKAYRDAAYKTCGRLIDDIGKLAAQTVRIHDAICPFERFDCGSGKECSDCIVEKIAELKANQLPEGVEWPRFADGGQLCLGDQVHHEDVDGFTAYKVGFYADGCVVVEDADGCVVVSPDGVFDRPKQTEQNSLEKLCMMVPFVEEDGTVIVCICSECDAAVLYRAECKYCPHCGARVVW